MRTLLIICTFIFIGMGLAYAWETQFRSLALNFNSKDFKHQFVIVQANQLLGFSLVDPEQAPLDIRESVMRGFRLVMYTGYYAPQYAHNELSCTNCHFAGGDTIGGKNNGISLVGVTTMYPQYSKRAGRVITIRERINNCFMRSMNGKALPENSRMMNDIINYLKWISKEVESIKNIPWLGLPEIRNKHTPDPSNGEKIYVKFCASCHQIDGEGSGYLGDVEGKTIPPLWGSKSFNDGAGMGTMRMLAPFIYLNMPYQQAALTEEQSLDVAAYIIQQPRPHFNHR